MPFAPPVGAARHAEELRWNRRAWDSKPLLREIYYGLYRQIAAQIDPARRGPVVEIGSSIGRIKEVLPACITTDLEAHDWLDRQENAYALTFPAGSVSHLILFDVWHHLQFPGTALAEFHRVLEPGGRVILLEPAISWLGRVTYGLLHYEPVGLRDAIAWTAPAGFDPQTSGYYAAQGNATRQFWWRQASAHLTQWHVRSVVPIVSLTYFATGGFSRPQIGGPRFFRLVQAFERVAARAPRLFASRLLVVLEKPCA